MIKSLNNMMVRSSLPSTLSICTNDKPIGEGRCGDRVPSTPVRSPFNLGGDTLA